MIRSRFRDFDWMLLGIVMVLSVISVLEIRSATEMTKFHGFQQKQMVFLAVGAVGDVRVCAGGLSPAAADFVLGVWGEPGVAAGCEAGGDEGAGGSAMD